SLEERVRRKSEELERTHEQLRAIEATRAQAQERSRIMQDMHDGLGSQLVSSLALAQSGKLSADQTYDLLRSCIDDLRLAVDAANHSSSPFAIALGNLRFRLEPRLQAAGMEVQWTVDGVDEDLPLARERVLPILRILQESIANTLKHARARTLHVAVASDRECLTLDLRDDGGGFDVESASRSSRGKGLASVAKRARVLGAKLTIASDAAGTRVHLAVPLDTPQPSAPGPLQA
ncbi:MAG TPA: ATP-binding protein, partial [Ramlibacter sp.]|nr:ATP-binding protein [Ramlibacter sp.]